MRNDHVRHWMSTRLIAVTPKTALAEAYRRMKEYGIQHLPVVEFERLVGLVTLGDIHEAEPPHGENLNIDELTFQLSRLKVEDVMNVQPITLPPEATIRQAARCMYVNEVGVLAILDERRLVGLLTKSDIVRAFSDERGQPPPDQDQGNEAQKRVRIGPTPPGKSINISAG